MKMKVLELENENEGWKKKCKLLSMLISQSANQKKIQIQVF